MTAGCRFCHCLMFYYLYILTLCLVSHRHVTLHQRNPPLHMRTAIPITPTLFKDPGLQHLSGSFQGLYGEGVGSIEPLAVVCPCLFRGRPRTHDIRLKTRPNRYYLNSLCAFATCCCAIITSYVVAHFRDGRRVKPWYCSSGKMIL